MSHFDWQKDREIVATCRLEGGPIRHVLFTDGERDYLLCNVRTGEGVRLAAFDMREKRYLGGETRCDLHPRWKASGDQILVDALEAAGGTRHVHVVERGSAGCNRTSRQLSWRAFRATIFPHKETP